MAESQLSIIILFLNLLLFFAFYLAHSWFAAIGWCKCYLECVEISFMTTCIWIPDTTAQVSHCRVTLPAIRVTGGHIVRCSNWPEIAIGISARVR